MYPIAGGKTGFCSRSKKTSKTDRACNKGPPDIKPGTLQLHGLPL